ncbi:MAG: hypothetical protein IPP77_12430 [Bacteroidetes bacterium]|nr:hypothetical protein [Bacteroidota bacterium]
MTVKQELLQPPVDIPGRLNNISGPGDATVIIECLPSKEICFKINQIANFPSDFLSLIGDTGYVSISVSVASDNPVPESANSYISLRNTIYHQAMTETEYNHYKSLYGPAQEIQVYGTLSSYVHEPGSEFYYIQCTPSPSWCIRYAKIPRGSMGGLTSLEAISSIIHPE